MNLRDTLPQDKRFNAYKYSGELRSVCAAMMGKMKTGEDVAKVYDIISRTYLFEAKDVFDSYCIKSRRTSTVVFVYPKIACHPLKHPF